MKKLAKYSALLLNLIVIILGAVTIYFGSKFITTTMIDLRVKEMAIAQLVIIMGSFSIILALLGSIAIWLHSYKLWSAGVGVASIMIFLEELTCILCLTAVNDMSMHTYITEMLTSWFYRYNEDNVRKLKVDDTQSQHKCCGLNNYTYWENQIPDSCCIKPKCSPQNSYQIGCVDAVSNAVDQILQDSGHVILALLLATSILTLLVIYLRHSIIVRRREQIDPIQRLQALESIGAVSRENRRRSQ